MGHSQRGWLLMDPNDQSLKPASGKGTTFQDMGEAEWMSLESSVHPPGARRVPGPPPT